MAVKDEERFVIDLGNILEQQIYTKLMDIHWRKIEEFKEQMHGKIESDSRIIAKIKAEEIMKELKKARKL